MASDEDASNAIVGEIERLLDLNVLDGPAGSFTSSQRAVAVLQLAEAYAWLTSPSQPHGGK